MAFNELPDEYEFTCTKRLKASSFLALDSKFSFAMLHDFSVVASSGPVSVRCPPAVPASFGHLLLLCQSRFESSSSSRVSSTSLVAPTLLGAYFLAWLLRLLAVILVPHKCSVRCSVPSTDRNCGSSCKRPTD